MLDLRVLFTATLLLLCLARMGSARSCQQERSSRVLFIGDSPVFDGSASRMGFYRIAERILASQCPSTTLEIESKRTWTSGEVLQEIEKLLTLHHPTDVILMLGTMEAQTISMDDAELLERDIQQYSSNMRQIAIRIMSRGVNVTLCTPLVAGEKVSTGGVHDEVLDEMTGVLLGIAADHVEVKAAQFGLKAWPLSPREAMEASAATAAEELAAATAAAAAAAMDATIALDGDQQQQQQQQFSSPVPRTAPPASAVPPPPAASTARFVDIRTELVSSIESLSREDLAHNVLTYDGVHLNRRGHGLVAQCLLAAHFEVYTGLREGADPSLPVHQQQQQLGHPLHPDAAVHLHVLSPAEAAAAAGGYSGGFTVPCLREHGDEAVLDYQHRRKIQQQEAEVAAAMGGDANGGGAGAGAQGGARVRVRNAAAAEAYYRQQLEEDDEDEDGDGGYGYGYGDGNEEQQQGQRRRRGGRRQQGHEYEYGGHHYEL